MVLRRPFESAQHASERFRHPMDDHGIVCSMMPLRQCLGQCGDGELLLLAPPSVRPTRLIEPENAARTDMFDYIKRFYNTTRRRSTISHLSPAEHDRCVTLAYLKTRTVVLFIAERTP